MSLDLPIRPRNVAVVGGGLMGHGIALVMALAGHRVKVQEPSSEARTNLGDRFESSAKSIGLSANEIAEAYSQVSIHEAVEEIAFDADVLFEAAPEKLDLKRELFSRLECLVPRHCILASNTSVIQITKIVDGIDTAHRCVGTHWWIPPHQIPLVEIIKTKWSAPQTADEMFALLRHARKTPVLVEKDVPGFIGNRLQHALWREAMSLVERGICDAAAVDTVVKSSFGRRLAVLGPLENADLVGTDLSLDIHENLLFDLETSAAPMSVLKQHVAEGRLGMKSGEGFYRWDENQSDELRKRVATHLKKLDGILPD